ncbi:MAG: iron export ABC transporter permease subunit FetB [Opitutales bacterium]|nr:iron export ABC transporter permease subunit FetB [Opitutales bacterium]MBT6767647.1 iron export ABC transporter permease subunit FetB [Opitutales bacterium]
MTAAIDLNYWDIAFAASIVLGLGVLLAYYRLGVTRSLVVASIRLVIQLQVIGYVLKFLFAEGRLVHVAIMATLMLLVASREIMVRQKLRLKGWASFGVGASTLFVSSFAVALFGLLVVVKPEPWYLPQYAIPLLGMIMSNTMSGVSLSMDRLTSALRDNRAIIEQRLALGQSSRESIQPYLRDCIRTGIMPVVNSMATAGIVSLPGMMTGQILAGADPTEAVKYQIIIWFFIAAGVGFGMATALRLLEMRLFDDRQRLRLDRLVGE